VPMKNNIIISVIVIVILFVAFAGHKYYQSPSYAIKTAQAKENKGECKAARADYFEALRRSTDSRAVPFIPEKFKARVLDPSLWHKDLGDYINWLFTESKSQPQTVQNLLEHIAGCTTAVEKENYYLVDSMKLVPFDKYRNRWVEVFYPETAQVPPGQLPLIERSFKHDLSIVTFHGEKSFSYEVNIVDCLSGKKSDFKIDYEREISVPLRPGTYCFFSLSKKSYSAKQEWISDRAMLPFTAPDSSSIISIYLKTQVLRKK
jgi:hypothetical protein